MSHSSTSPMAPTKKPKGPSAKEKERIRKVKETDEILQRLVAVRETLQHDYYCGSLDIFIEFVFVDATDDQKTTMTKRC
jgi:hypothetical protein